MTEKNYLTVGNVTTLINSFIVVIAGYIFGFLVSIFGVGLPITESQLTSLLSAFVFAVFAYINAKDHNNFWDKDEDYIKIPLDLDDAQIKAIENFISYQTGDDIIIKETPNTDEDEVILEDCDPAFEYEDKNDGA